MVNTSGQPIPAVFKVRLGAPMKMFFPRLGLDMAFPHRDRGQQSLTRGQYRVSTTAETLPSGKAARLVLMWMSTSLIQRDGSVDAETGRIARSGLRDFMVRADASVGGRQYDRIERQLSLLLSCRYSEHDGQRWRSLSVSRQNKQGEIVLTRQFMHRLAHAISVDSLIVRQLRSSMSVDLYLIARQQLAGASVSYDDMYVITGNGGRSRFKQTVIAATQELEKTTLGAVSIAANGFAVLNDLTPVQDDELEWDGSFPTHCLWHHENGLRLYQGDAKAVMSGFPAQSIDCVVTSPPYFNQRNYSGGRKEIGREDTSDAYIKKLVGVFHEVKRILADDGTLWLNIDDCYSTGDARDPAPAHSLMGLPWRLALAMMQDGWLLRNEVIWHKTRVLPGASGNRLNHNHEQIFLFTKTDGNTYNIDDVRIPLSDISKRRFKNIENQSGSYRANGGAKNIKPVGDLKRGRNLRDVWPICPSFTHDAHFAVFPVEIPERCIKAGCKRNGIVLDPFNGSGTTGLAARSLGRKYVGIDLNEDYLMQSKRKILGS
ncbi:hypothetical protein DF200_05875 [Bifidobacterium catulorum]|uniref:site-specific DNA-methyltransferase (cytosine-N(4)-specific) n=2 Tax=Bifidobacterium catulorum TaxID=1630173 RepID=A0A2U2MSB8_9BIFI|nr:hypothetical protein DF200_05875 [Bifidobacterium catulorum]